MRGRRGSATSMIEVAFGRVHVADKGPVPPRRRPWPPPGDVEPGEMTKQRHVDPPMMRGADATTPSASAAPELLLVNELRFHADRIEPPLRPSGGRGRGPVAQRWEGEVGWPDRGRPRPPAAGTARGPKANALESPHLTLALLRPRGAERECLSAYPTCSGLPFALGRGEVFELLLAPSTYTWISRAPFQVAHLLIPALGPRARRPAAFLLCLRFLPASSVFPLPFIRSTKPKRRTRPVVLSGCVADC